MTFELKGSDTESKARAGVIKTDHGSIETPIFMPVGTVASVKGVHQRELKMDINPDIILGNTYHLYLRPQTPILEKAGGLHKFMNTSIDRYYSIRIKICYETKPYINSISTVVTRWDLW